MLCGRNCPEMVQNRLKEGEHTMTDMVVELTQELQQMTEDVCANGKEIRVGSRYFESR